jgi:hypothetical protein
MAPSSGPGTGARSVSRALLLLLGCVVSKQAIEEDGSAFEPHLVVAKIEALDESLERATVPDVRVFGIEQVEAELALFRYVAFRCDE